MNQSSKRSLCCLLVAGIIMSMPLWVLAASTSNGNTTPNEYSEQEPGLKMNSPGSVVQRVEDDARNEESLFQFPGLSNALKPWYDLKAGLDKNHGLKFGLSYTSIYKKASNVFGPEDDAAGFDLDISGSWTFLGRDTQSPTTLGFNFFWRDTLGTNFAPQRLFTQFGGLYSTDAPYGEEDPVIGEFWIQQRFNNKYGFRIGKIFPITAYDFFPFKNFRTDFTDFNHVTNNAIPLPGNGLGAFAMYRPDPKILMRLGVHDANADVQESGFDTYDDELFVIFETGIDIGRTSITPGKPPKGHAHISIWNQDDRKKAGIDGGWGIASTILQRFGHFTPFVRYGYADGGAKGPTPVKHMVNMGLVIDHIFGQSDDRVGIGYTWSDPANGSLDIQHEIDSYYRVQLTPEIEIGPTIQIIFDPVNYPDEDTIFVGGLRFRVAL